MTNHTLLSTKPSSPVNRLLIYATFGALFLIVTTASKATIPTITIQGVDAASFGTSLLFFFVLALIFERAVEVVLETLCGASQVKARKETNALIVQADTLATREKQILAGFETPAERLDYLSKKSTDGLLASAQNIAKAKGETSRKLAEIKIIKSRLAGLLLLLLGGAASLNGLLILTDLLLAVTSDLGADVLTVKFKVLDVLVTTLVLGGGANGIHKIMKKILKEVGHDHTTAPD